MRSGLPLLLLSLTIGATGCKWPADPSERPFETVIVARGDTLFELARAHGVTVEELRAWNGIEGDLIEVGQPLTVYLDARTALPAPAPRASPRAAPTASGLSMPAPKPCLAPPQHDELGENGVAASAGLSQEQARAALAAFVGHTLACIPSDADIPSNPLLLELTVGCDGRVMASRVADRAGWPGAVATCAAETLRFTPFPAHGLPDGDIVVYPLTYSSP
jgi:hypothetical protein